MNSVDDGTMRLIRTGDLEFEEFLGENLPKYAILSHTWEQEEVSYQEMIKSPENQHVRSRLGYTKIVNCYEYIANTGFDYVWIDTCCINKESSAELSEAINSMNRWYSDAVICYAYLADVPMVKGNFEANPYFAKSRWFTRGWTLQELIAPEELIFLASDWKALAPRGKTTHYLAQITGIHEDILKYHRPSLKRYSIAQRMSWAAKRTTTRIEDRAYCLMGLFDVNMPLLYGEGAKAFSRLQTAIINQSDDHTIFAWTDQHQKGSCRGLLAPDASYFEDSRDFETFPYEAVSRPYTMTNMGLQIQLNLSKLPNPYDPSQRPIFAAPLNCRHDYRGRLVLLLTYVEYSSGPDIDQFCRTDLCIAQDIPNWRVNSASLRTIFFKQEVYILREPNVIWVRNIPARDTGYTLDRMVPSSKPISKSVMKNPEHRLLLLNASDSTHGSMMFTHPNQGTFEISLDRYRRNLNICVHLTETELHTWATDGRWHFSVEAPNWIKIGAHLECILGVLVYVLDIDVDKRNAGGLSTPIHEELDDSKASSPEDSSSNAIPSG